MIGRNYQFPEINDEMYKKLEKWWNTHNKGKCAKSRHGAIGGAITFEITPTSIGDCVEAKCSCGSIVCLLELE